MDWSNPQSYTGWLQLAGGVATIVMELVSYFAGGHVSGTNATIGAALAAGGVGHIASTKH